MTFKQAREKLKHAAHGDYHSISYELTSHHDGEEVETCTIYIDGEKHHHGRTWEEAFKSRVEAAYRSQEPLEDVK